MASSAVPIKKSIVHEGSYAPAFGVNGETYKGIDRRQQPGWPGWKIIDEYKKKRFSIPKYSILKNVQLDNQVIDFYTKNFWPKSKAGLLNNQTFAENYFDFYFHKPAIAVAAIKAAAGKNDLESAITTVNANPEETYTKFYNLRLAHYNNSWMNGSGKNKIYYKPGKNGTQATQLRRAKSYPEKLAKQSFFYSGFLNYFGN